MIGSVFAMATTLRRAPYDGIAKTAPEASGLRTEHSAALDRHWNKLRPPVFGRVTCPGASWMANSAVTTRLTRIASNIPEFPPVLIIFGMASPDAKPMAYGIVKQKCEIGHTAE